MIPRLETERLCLRAFRQADLDAWAAISADPEVMTYLGGPVSRADSWWALAVTLGGKLYAVDVWFITCEEWRARR